MLYHRNAYGLPEFESRVLNVRHGRHTLDRAKEKGINLPNTVEISEKTVIEIDTSEGEKYTVRFHHDAKNDIVMVVMGDGFVRTAWLNAKNDRHRTLDKSRYSRLTSTKKAV